MHAPSCSEATPFDVCLGRGTPTIYDPVIYSVKPPTAAVAAAPAVRLIRRRCHHRGRRPYVDFDYFSLWLEWESEREV